MGDLAGLVQDKYQDVESNAAPLSNVLTGGFRTPPDMPSEKGELHNGRDLTRPAGEPATVSAAPATAGSATFTVDDPIELITFGTVYRDRASAFGHDTLDDGDPKVDLAQLGGHAIQYRAALEREAILLGGFFSAHMAALAERDQDEGTLGKAMAVVGNLLGGGGGMGGKAEPADLGTYVTQLQTIGGQIDVDTITYEVTHQAGIDLHDLRASYVAYLEDQIGKGKTAAPDAGLLATIPLLSKVLPKEIGNIFTLVEKMSTKAFDIYVKVVLGLTRTMMPVIETTCRDITVDAITGKRTPMFSVWLPPPAATDDKPAHLIEAPKAPKPTGLSPVDSLIGSVIGTAAGVVNTVDEKADPVIDFLTKPGRKAPGGPFLDEIFAQLDDGSGYLKAAAGVTGIGELVRTAVEQAFGYQPGELPGFVEAIVDKVCSVHADFLRGVFGVLVTLDPSQPLVEADLVAAGRAHLVTQLIESVAHGLTFLDKIRAFKFKLDLFGPIEKTLSGEALYQRGLELVNEELGPHLDPLVTLLMKHFHDALESARLGAQPGMTMEVYLSQLPSLYALLFRKTFFPIWDLIVDTVLKPVSDLLDPMVGRVDDLAKKAKGIVDTVRTGLLRATNVITTALTQGIQGGLGGTNLGAYRAALNSVLPPGATPPDAVAPSTTFPFPERKTTGAGTPVDDATRAKVEPKWQDDPPDSAPAATPAAA